MDALLPPAGALVGWSSPSKRKSSQMVCKSSGACTVRSDSSDEGSASKPGIIKVGMGVEGWAITVTND